jgi:hypothetical protein
MAGPRKVRIGQPMTGFPGRSFNLLVEQWYRSNAHLARPSKGPTGAGQILVVKAKNVTGATLNYGHCVAIEDLAIDVVDKPRQVYRRPLLKANKPTSTLNHSVLGVALKPMLEGHPGPFIVAGPAWLRCDVTDIEHGFAALKPDQVTFTEYADSGTSGVPILARELTATGEQWALCLLGSTAAAPPGPVKFQIVESVPGATWDDTLGELEPAYFKARLFTPQIVSDALTGLFIPQVDDEDDPLYVRGVSYLTDGVTISSGRFRIGLGMRVSGDPWDKVPFYDEGAFDEEDWETFPVTLELFNASCLELDL